MAPKRTRFSVVPQVFTGALAVVLIGKIIWPELISAGLTSALLNVYVSTAGVLTDTLVGATVTAIDGGGAMMVADVVKVCTGPLMVPPKLVSVTDSELIGMVNVPVLPGSRRIANRVAVVNSGY